MPPFKTWLPSFFALLGITACATNPSIPQPQPDLQARGQPETESEPPSEPESEPPSKPEPEPQPPSEPEPELEPEPEPEPEPQANPTSRVAGANIRVGSLEADGLAARDLECRATSGAGGLFGTLGIIAALAKSKKALDACAPKGDAPTVLWTASSSAVSDVRVEDTDEKTARCVGRALQRAVMPLEGDCAAIILIGERSGAEQTLATRKGLG